MKRTHEKRIQDLETEIRLNHKDILTLKKLVIEVCSFAIADDLFSHMSTRNYNEATKLYRETKDHLDD